MTNEVASSLAETAPKIGKPIHSIITRLTAWYALVTLLILLLLGMSVESTLRSTLIKNADHDQMWFVQNVFLPRASRAATPADIVTRRMVERLQRPSDAHTPTDLLMSKLWPRVLNLNGNPLSPNLLPDTAIDPKAFQAGATGKTVTTDIEIDGRQVRVVTAPIFQNGHQVGVLQNARPLLDDERQEDLTSVMTSMRSFVWIAVIISTITALFLTGRAICPIRTITASASRIGSDYLSARLDVQGKDEFADLASTFNGMLDRLEDGFKKMEQAYEQQRRFTGDASHELRTPLTIIKANASLALSNAKTPEEYVAALKTIDSAADRTNRLIQDLLLLARADAGQIEIDKRDVTVREIVQSAMSHIDLTDSDQSAMVELREIPTSLMIFANSDMVIRIVDNLVSNSLRHTPATGSVTISADKADTGNFARIRVQDSGEGISAEHLPFLMDRFYRADKSRIRKMGGTGLGLAICKSIVDLHNGKILVQSEPGKGTTVDVYLPIPSEKDNDKKLNDLVKSQPADFTMNGSSASFNTQQQVSASK
jgi:heavy metal sensor kinase